MTRRIALLCVLLPFTACFGVTHGYDGDKVLTSDAGIPGFRAVPVSHFALQDRQFFFLHGGYPVGKPLNGAALAAEQIGSHDAVVNLRIWDGQDVGDSAITHVACLLSLLCGSWSVWVEGDVVDLEAE